MTYVITLRLIKTNLAVGSDVTSTAVPYQSGIELEGYLSAFELISIFFNAARNNGEEITFW